MTTSLDIVDSLLDVIERDADRPFIGPRVAAAVRESKHRYLWLPLIDRYRELIGGKAAATTLPTHIYCDIACTLITKKVMMVDLDFLYETSADEEEDITSLREAHMVVAKRYLVKMLTCIYECVHGQLPNSVDVTNAVVLLYAELYAEAFDPVTILESSVFAIVQNWFSTHVERPTLCETYFNVAPGGPFLHCSHAYWLWLHLTAAKVQQSQSDLVTVIYALDSITYCNTCKVHLLELIPEFFVHTREHGLTDCYCRYPNDMALFHIHNRVNASTGSPNMDVSVLSDYERFWNWGKK